MDADVDLLCEEPSCQGDLTGEWEIVGACLDEFQMEDERTQCPEWSCRVVAADASGTFLFGADGHADVAVHVTTESECNVPIACLDAGDTCAIYQADTPGSTCRDGADACACTETSAEDGGIVGDWRVIDGRSLEITNETGMVAGNDWCVTPTELRITWLVGANSASPVTKVALVARRVR